MGARVELEVVSSCPNNKAQSTITPTLQAHEIAYTYLVGIGGTLCLLSRCNFVFKEAIFLDFKVFSTYISKVKLGYHLVLSLLF
jgi:hypothetical protein